MQTNGQQRNPTVYKFHFGRRTLYWSALHIAAYTLLGVSLYMLYEGGYFSAWFTSFIAALVALMALSIPSKIVVTDERVEIRCLCDLTEIRRDEIASVRMVPREEMRWHVPLFGGFGFFGYYGHYLDLRQLERVRIYASEWRDFVEITDIYDESVIVSCRHARELVEQLAPAASAGAGR